MRMRRVRPRDALSHLERALSAPLGSALRQQRLEHALLVYMLGKYWQTAKIGDRRCNSGRPRRDDTELVADMRRLSKATGEVRPYRLARLVLGPPGEDDSGWHGRRVRLVRAYYRAFPQTAR